MDHVHPYGGHRSGDPRDHLVPLETLDLSKCRTVSDIVARLSLCAFGGRMLGDVGATLTDLCRGEHKPALIYDGEENDALGRHIRAMCEPKSGFFSGLHTTEDYVSWRGPHSGGTALVVGPYMARHARHLYEKADRLIFVNREGLCKPGQVRDGYYPDAVFEDPEFVIPLLDVVLRERLQGIPTTPRELFDMLRTLKFGGVAADTVAFSEVLSAMLQDKRSTNFFTVSGAMTIAKMQLLICDLIRTGRINYIAATGALMAHGLIEGVGCKHYKYDPSYGDDVLAKVRLNRVTDTLEPEENFDAIEKIVTAVFDRFDGETTVGSWEIHRAIGASSPKTSRTRRVSSSRRSSAMSRSWSRRRSTANSATICSWTTSAAWPPGVSSSSSTRNATAACCSIWRPEPNSWASARSEAAIRATTRRTSPRSSRSTTPASRSNATRR